MSEAIEQEIRTLRAQFWSRRDPEGRAFVPLADAYRRKGDLDEAVSLVQDGLARLPDFTPGHLVAARIHRAKGDLEDARAALDHLLELDSANVLALLERAEVARDTGDHEGAVSDLRRLLELDSGHMGARAALDRLEAAPPEPPVAGPEPTGPEPTDVVSEDDEAFDFDLSGFDEEGAPAATEKEAPTGGAEFGEDELLGADIDVDIEAGLDADIHTGMDVEIDSDLVLDAEPLAEAPELPDVEDQAEPDQAEPDLADFADPVEAEASMEPPEGNEDDGSLMTRTMADIFVRQGLTERAVEVYERLLERDPHDDELRARLEELKAKPRPATAGEQAEAPETSPEPGAGPEPELSEMAPQWADDGADDAETPSPFAWDETEDEFPDEPQAAPGTATAVDASRAESSRTIRDHFDDLLAWEPGAVPVEALSPGADESQAPEGSLLDLRRRAETEPTQMPEAPAPAAEEEEDLDDFRSWLESLDS